MLFISVLSFNVFAQFSVQEAEDNMEKVMDFDGKVKIVSPNKQKVYISSSDILSYRVYTKDIMGATLEIKTKNGEVIEVWGAESLYSMSYDKENKLLIISPETK